MGIDSPTPGEEAQKEWAAPKDSSKSSADDTWVFNMNEAPADIQALRKKVQEEEAEKVKLKARIAASGHAQVFTKEEVEAALARIPNQEVPSSPEPKKSWWQKILQR